MKDKIITKLLMICCAVLLCGCGRRAQFQTSDGKDVTAVLEGYADGADETCRTDTTDTDEKETEYRDRESNADSDVDGDGSTEDKTCYIHVCGAVHYPGVYELREGARLCEAIDMAGGVTEDAYADGVNLALEVVDGSRVRIPTVEEWENGNYAEMAEAAGINELQTDRENGGTQAQLVNINTADASELVSLPGIGATRAEAIIAYRKEHGSFSSIEEIQKVSGIKSGLYNKIKDKIKI